MPFSWEPVAEVSCERFAMEHPRTTMVIGRRIDVPMASCDTRLEAQNSKPSHASSFH